jgi:hypothetical protein
MELERGRKITLGQADAAMDMGLTIEGPPSGPDELVSLVDAELELVAKVPLDKAQVVHELISWAMDHYPWKEG